MEKIAKIKGIADLESSLKANNPAITIKVNNELASDLGLTVSQIGAAVRPLVAGDVIGHWLAPDGQNYEVNVQLPKSDRRITADLGELHVASSKPGPDGSPVLVPLRQVVEFRESTSPQIIKRQELQRRVGIYANVEGRPSGDVGKEVQELLEDHHASAGLPLRRRRPDAGNGGVVHGARSRPSGMAVIFIYIILASQFGSFLQPLAIMASLPLHADRRVPGAPGHRQHAQHLLDHRHHHADGAGDQERDPAGGLHQPGHPRGQVAARRDPRRGPGAPAPDPHDDDGDDLRHAADGARLGRRRRAARADGRAR